MSNPHPLFFPHNETDPAYGMDSILHALVHNPESIGAETYVVKRNGAICTGIKHAIFVYDGAGPIPVSSRRKVPIITGNKEFTGYLRGYTTTEQFNSIGVKTWDKDANENESWLANPNRIGEGDIGQVYGAYARNLIGPNGEHKDLIAEQIESLRTVGYTRRNIINYFDPFCRGALPACMYEHAFTVHNGYLNVNSTQRSNDGSLGGALNPSQAHFFLNLMAKLTGYKVGWVVHNVLDFHIYNNQVEYIKQFIDNPPILPATAKLTIGEKIGLTTTLEDLEEMDIKDIFTVSNYQSHDKYEIPLTV